MKLLSTVLISLCFLVTGCSDQSIEEFKDMKPKLNILEYFEGDLEADGILFDRSGNPKRSFHATIKGERKQNTLTLNEHFIFNDGEKTQRIWEISFKNDQEFSATAGDVIGPAQGQQKGSAVNMKYVLRVPYKDSTLDVSMDDWMYLVNTKTIINRTTMRKFGFKVGELLLTIQKK